MKSSSPWWNASSVALTPSTLNLTVPARCRWSVVPSLISTSSTPPAGPSSVTSKRKAGSGSKYLSPLKVRLCSTVSGESCGPPKNLSFSRRSSRTSTTVQTRPSRAQFPRRPPKGGGSCTSSPPSENIESEERLLRDRREGLGRHPRRMPCCLAPRPCARSDLLVSRRGCTDHRDTRRDVHAGTAEKVGPIERHAP